MEMHEVHAAGDGVSLYWLGNDGWVINMYGTVFATDLDLCPGGRVPLPEGFDFDAMAKRICAMFITHGHGDHFNEKTCEMLIEKSGCMFVLPESCLSIAEGIGMPKNRIIVSRPGLDLDVCGLYVHCVRALHGHLNGSVYIGANNGDCGYTIEKNGFTIYEPGDTVLLHEHFEMKNVDLAFVSPTEHNMQVEKSLVYLNRLQPRYIIPQHYASYTETPENAFWTHGYVDELYDALDDEMKKRFIRMPGQGVGIRIV